VGGSVGGDNLTTVPNADIEPLHNRMPLVLDDDAAKWVLDELSLQQIAGFLKPCPDGWLPLAPASPLVNDVRNDGPELIEPAPPGAEGGEPVAAAPGLFD
jgi:putative SOS response-associated peptidase YedK